MTFPIRPDIDEGNERQRARKAYKQKLIEAAFASLNAAPKDRVIIEERVVEKIVEVEKDPVSGFLEANALEGEDKPETSERLHRELSILLTKKHIAPLEGEDKTRFKVLTEGLGKG